MDFQTIVEDIKNLKIQGAKAVAKAAVDALRIVADGYKDSRKVDQIHYLNKAKLVLFKTRPTEPCMRNSLNYVLDDIESADDVYDEICKRAGEVRDHFKNVEQEIAKIGSKKIKNGMVIFTHCHSSTVIGILREAKQQGKRFKVHNTETRPLFQGRKTAYDLAISGIPVRHYIDSAARLALKKADLMLIGADAITAEGKVINKIGSELFAETAERRGVPVYCCSDSWKFDPLTIFGYEEVIEQRLKKEVWLTPPKGVLIDNHAFENVSADLITGVISEIGIYRPEVFVGEVKRVYPWIFK